MLNEVLVDHLMDKLFVPYYIHSLAPPDKYIIVETEEVNKSYLNILEHLIMYVLLKYHIMNLNYLYSL